LQNPPDTQAVRTAWPGLADCGYVEVRREGRFSYYRVAGSRVVDLVRLARGLAADNAAELAACGRIDPGRGVLDAGGA
jgi:ArsR family transcriptional regulator, cadmium/lead-responsive transcriptional repressor